MNPWLLLLGVALVGAVLFGSTKVWGYVKGVPTELEVEPIGGGFLLRSDAAKAFRAMQADANSDGVLLKVNTAFRTQAEQEKLYADFKAGVRTAVAAEPGFSNHQGGIAVDIETAGGANAAFRWLTANAAKYSYVRTVRSEPWHWEYRPDLVRV